MKQIKVSEATGPALDWLIAICEGHKPATLVGLVCIDGAYHEDGYSPSTDWAQGGPIKEAHQINTTYCNGHVEATFKGHYGQGPTELIAAMRCYVASKFGETSEVPEELA